MRILVGIPEKHSVDAESTVSVANIERLGHEIEFAHSDGRGVYGPGPARNRLVVKAIEGGYDKLLMVDSDIVVPRNVLEFLTEPWHPIVLGVYRYKNETGDCPFFKFGASADSDCWKWGEIPLSRFEIKAGGMGCAMVDVSVFAKLKKPWFHWDERESGRHTGEDIWFCKRAKSAGFGVFADGRVKCSHVGRKVYK